MLRLITNSFNGGGMETPSQGYMRCSQCGIDKPFSEMTAVAIKGTKKWKRCKACENAYAKKWRDVDRESVNEYHRQWRNKQGPALKARNSSLRREKMSKMTQDELVSFRAAEAKKVREYAALLKNEVFMAYGGWRCACCGESERAFLSLDHVNNDGFKDRVNGRKSSNYSYRQIKKAGFPSGIYQVLCMNCNFGKHMNNGVCPHKQGVTTMAQASRLK